MKLPADSLWVAFWLFISIWVSFWLLPKVVVVDGAGGRCRWRRALELFIWAYFWHRTRMVPATRLEDADPVDSMRKLMIEFSVCPICGSRQVPK